MYKSGSSQIEESGTYSSNVCSKPRAFTVIVADENFRFGFTIVRNGSILYFFGHDVCGWCFWVGNR